MMFSNRDILGIIFTIFISLYTIQLTCGSPYRSEEDVYYAVEEEYVEYEVIQYEDDFADGTTEHHETTAHTTTEYVTTSSAGVSLTSSPPGDSQTTSPPGGSQTTSSQDTTTTQTSLTSMNPIVCADGRFGPLCELCNCLNVSEVCDKQTGACTSGCAIGWSGHACLTEKRPGDTSVVFMLAVLVALLAVLCIAQCLYLLILVPRRKARMSKYSASTRGQENNGFEIDDVNVAEDSNRNSAIELRRSVARIRETNIQVMADPLGEGRFGDIMKGYLKHEGTTFEVAYKTLKPEATEEEKVSFSSQLEVYSSFEPHPNIIRFYGLCTVGDSYFAAFEYAPYGNLRNFLRNSAMPEGQSGEVEMLPLKPRGKLLRFAYEIALGMRHLARARIVHRELCSQHILLGENLQVKVAGLNVPNGGAKNLPMRWMSPESHQTGQFTVQSDVWSYGVTLWEIMSMGNKPFPELSAAHVATNVSNGARMGKPEGCDSDIYGLMRWCWHENPEDRPTFLLLSNTLREMIDSGQVRLDLTDDSDIEGDV